MEIILVWFVTSLCVLFCAVYYYLTRNFNYWKNRNVLGPQPVPFFGTFKDFELGKVNLADFLKTICDAYPDEKVVGLFDRTKPSLLIKDLDIVKDVLIKDFDNFPNRGVRLHPEIEPFATNLFNLDHKLWRPLRKKLTPSFTTGKLKEMFYLIDECTQEFVNHLETLVTKDEPIECHELASKFTTDVIGLCAFGLSFNAIKDENSEFRKIGRQLFAHSWTNKLRHATRTLPRWVAILAKPFASQRQVFNFFYNTIIQTMKYRSENNIRRNDYIDALRDMKERSEQDGEGGIPDIVIISQAYAFFLGAFDSPSVIFCFAMYELALNPTIQDTLRKEIVTVMDRNGGKLNYESLNSLKYLEKVLQETLRKYSLAIILTREAEKDYTFEKLGLSISKGTKIYVPVYSIHRDPNIYPDPEKFDPERFDNEVARSRPQMTFLPFGDGPRVCIGLKFSMVEMKLVLAATLKRFKFEVCDKTFKLYVKRKNTLLLMPKDRLYLKIKKI